MQKISPGSPYFSALFSKIRDAAGKRRLFTCRHSTVGKESSGRPKFLWHSLALAALTLVGFGLRVYGVQDVFLWRDDTDFFNRALYDSPGVSLSEYSLDRKQHTTHTLGWPAMVWMSAKLFGPTPGGARMVSVIGGTLAIPAVFFVMYVVLAGSATIKPLLPSLLAAAATTICINQIELSQRLYAYGATPLFSALVILAYLNLWSALREAMPRAGRVNSAFLLYAIAGAMALCVNSSLALSVLASGLALGWMLLREALRRRERLLELASAAGLAALALSLAQLLNFKNPAYGYRYYMQPYYHALDMKAPWFLARQAYDLLTYNLDIFYNTALYWPQSANFALVPLVGACIAGWLAAAKGRFGPMARNLAGLGLLATCVPAAFSLLKIYTFGGDRRTLYLSPFIFTFTSLGLYLAGTVRGLRSLVVVGGSVYLLLWAAGIPSFYEDRKTPYSTADLVTLWQDNGKPPIEVAGGGAITIKYALREHPEIAVYDMPYALPPPPYLYVSFHWPLEQDQWDVHHIDRLRQNGYKTTLLAQRPAKYMRSWDYPTSLYFPPNGFWVYKVTAQ